MGKKRLGAAILLFCWIAILCAGVLFRSPRRQVASETGPKKFERAAVFAGGGFHTAVFLGMLAGLEEAGKKPDVVIGTCGGSLAVIIANAYPDSASRKNLIESPEFHQAVLGIRLANPSITSALKNVMGMIGRKWGLKDGISNIYENYIMDVPAKLPVSGFEIPFQTTGIRALILGAAIGYGPDEVGMRRAGRKLYQETFFTDSELAKLLSEVKSGAFYSGQKTYVADSINILTNIPLGEAARASITDPHYMQPIAISGNHYLTGAVNLYPIEAAYALAQEVVMPFAGKFDTLVEQNMMISTFGFDNNDRLEQVTKGDADYWVDLSDIDELYKQASFNPKPKIIKMRLVEGVPNDYEEYLRRVRLQWEYGRSRALEALKLPKNSKSHIRVLIQQKEQEEHFRKQREQSAY